MVGLAGPRNDDRRGSSASTSATTMASDALMLALTKMVTGEDGGTVAFEGIEAAGE
jgi:hypothetical protein